MSSPLPLEEAQARLLAMAVALPVERVDVEAALGRYLAEPMLARRTQPAADLSAMDGYAVAAEDLAGPWQVVGESAAGHPFAGVVAGRAVRISTGALLPDGAGAVILQEDCRREGEALHLTGSGPSPADTHIRRKGLDYAEGAALLAAGTRIGAVHLALALSSGHNHLPVRRRPRVAIIDSGDELAPPGEICPPHRIPASNGAMLAALCAAVPCEINRFGPVPDDLSALREAFAAAGDADVIITSGGASVGDHDLLRPSLEAWGAELEFWRVAIKPGKPLLVARRGRQIILGLPGNPVSSLVTGYFFALPLLRALLGAQACFPRRISAVLATTMGAVGARREFVRGVWDGANVAPEAMRDSSALAAMAASNCLIDRPAQAAGAAAGSVVGLYLLENGGTC